MELLSDLNFIIGTAFAAITFIVGYVALLIAPVFIAIGLFEVIAAHRDGDFKIPTKPKKMQWATLTEPTFYTFFPLESWNSEEIKRW